MKTIMASFLGTVPLRPKLMTDILSASPLFIFGALGLREVCLQIMYNCVSRTVCLGTEVPDNISWRGTGT